MSKYKILVIGDSCLDVFVYCNCDRLCPEAPVPVLDVLNQEKNDGMAGNVVRNIEAILGYDIDKIVNDNYKEVTKTRYVDKKTNHMFLRIDSKTKINRIDKKTLHRIDYKKYDAIVISDYDKGFLTEEDITYIANNHKLTFLDSKKILGEWAEKITFIKINRKEFDNSKDFITSNQNIEKKIIKTIGGDGCCFRGKIYPVEDVEIKNLSGAGDTFLSGLVTEYVKSKNIDKAIVNANKFASIVVQKMGVSTIKD
jgi:D-beta-D-heptose 7-phosphate kinase/D-beta-D-heptose 1-phosphate adenosyltransferase